MRVGDNSINIKDVSFIFPIREEKELVYDIETMSYEDKSTHYISIILNSGVRIDIDDELSKLKKYKKQLDDEHLEKH